MTSILGLAYTYQNVNGTGNERYLNDHLTLGTTSNNDVKLVTNGVERMVIQANGAIDFKSPIEISAGLGSQEIEKVITSDIHLQTDDTNSHFDTKIVPSHYNYISTVEAEVQTFPGSYQHIKISPHENTGDKIEATFHVMPTGHFRIGVVELGWSQTSDNFVGFDHQFAIYSGISDEVIKIEYDNGSLRTWRNGVWNNLPDYVSTDPSFHIFVGSAHLYYVKMIN